MEFDFNSEVEETGWLVKDLVPIGHLCVVLAQAGIGKSLLVEYLSVCLTHGIHFCGFDTAFGDSTIVDQDTPINSIQKRLLRFSKGVNRTKIGKLYLESMNGYQLSNQSLFKAINKYPSKLTVVDSLHSVCGDLNPNSTGDMSRLATLKEKCINDNNTIIVNHHISEKTKNDIDTLMKGDTHKLSMGNSVIIQQADTYYIIGATAENGLTNRIYLRAISKRVSIPTKPIVLRLVQTENGGEIIEFEGYYEPELDNAEKDVLIVFRENPDENKTVKEVYESMGHKHGELKTREALASLEEKGLLAMSRHKSNLFKYRLP